MDALQDNHSSGLDNMRVRAAIISADLVFDQVEPDGGTRVIITVPRAQLSDDGDEKFSEELSMEAAQ